jgi:hypothetical protein
MLFRSTTNRIETDGKSNAEKMHELHIQALQSNTSLLHLVQDIHTMLLDSKRSPFPISAPPQECSPHNAGILPTRNSHPTVTGERELHVETIHSVRPHYSSGALVATIHLPSPTNKFPTPVRPIAMRRQLPLNNKVADRHPAPIRKLEKEKQAKELPTTIVLLNERRQLSGSKEFMEYQKKHHPPKPPSKPSFLILEVPTVSQLHEGLIYIFSDFHSTATRHATFNGDDQKKEIIRWTQGLERLLDSWAFESTLSSPHSTEVKRANRNEMIDLLIGLNGLIEESDDKMKRAFYHGTEQAGIDELLNKLQTVSNLVRGMKEVEEFKDVREEWKSGQNNG